MTWGMGMDVQSNDAGGSPGRYSGQVLSLWRGMIDDKRISMRQIAQDVAAAYGVSVEDLQGHSRVRKYAWPRQHAMWLMARQDHLSLPMIGHYLGGRDHMTVLHGRRRHQERVDAGTVTVTL